MLQHVLTCKCKQKTPEQAGIQCSHTICRTAHLHMHWWRRLTLNYFQYIRLSQKIGLQDNYSFHLKIGQMQITKEKIRIKKCTSKCIPKQNCNSYHGQMEELHFTNKIVMYNIHLVNGWSSYNFHSTWSINVKL